jgi:ATP-dependent helicase/nuclease subunit B
LDVILVPFDIQTQAAKLERASKRSRKTVHFRLSLTQFQLACRELQFIPSTDRLIESFEWFAITRLVTSQIRDLGPWDRIRKTRGFLKSIVETIRLWDRENINAVGLVKAVNAPDYDGPEDLKISSSIYWHFRNEIQQRGRITPGDVFRLATKSVAQFGIRSLGTNFELSFAKFPAQFPASEMTFLRKLLELSRSSTKKPQNPAGGIIPVFPTFRCKPPLDEPTATKGDLKLTCRVVRIEGPGEEGEIILVAEQIRQLLSSNVTPSEIGISSTNPDLYNPLLTRIFRSSQIFASIPMKRRFGDNPGIRFLIRMIRIPAQNYSFVELSLMLRSNFFQPRFVASRELRDLCVSTDAALRKSGIVEGQSAWLNLLSAKMTTVISEGTKWLLRELLDCFEPLTGLKHRSDFVKWVEEIIDKFAPTLASHELQDWISCLKLLPADEMLSYGEWLEEVIASVDYETLTRREIQSGQIAITSIEEGLSLNFAHWFILGLDEGTSILPARNFTQPSLPNLWLHKHGFLEANPGNHVENEKRIWSEIIAHATNSLYLCNPAFRQDGKPRSANPFLLQLQQRLPPSNLMTTKRTMLIEGYFQNKPSNLSQFRSQLTANAHAMKLTLPSNQINLDRSQVLLLNQVSLMNSSRFRQNEFGPFDGLISERNSEQASPKRFGKEFQFSPTQLEDYQSCPFQFWFRHGLNLRALDDPTDEVENSRRGILFHDAMEQFHRDHPRIQDVTSSEIKSIEPWIQQSVQNQLYLASSEFQRTLWELEARRLCRFARLYLPNWKKYTDEAMQVSGGNPPIVEQIEFTFGMNGEPPVEVHYAGETVLLRGRIDRVDTIRHPSEILFWILDYKTGKTQHYQKQDLLDFSRIQLPLYALAVDSILSKEAPTIPMGMGYWELMNKGWSPLFPFNSKSSKSEIQLAWSEYSEQLSAVVLRIVQSIRSNQFVLAPRDEIACEGCAYRKACRIGSSRTRKKVGDTMKVPVVDGANNINQ